MEMPIGLRGLQRPSVNPEEAKQPAVAAATAALPALSPAPYQTSNAVPSPRTAPLSPLEPQAIGFTPAVAGVTPLTPSTESSVSGRLATRGWRRSLQP